MRLNHIIQYINSPDKKGLLIALENIAEIDNDFNGNNGDEYLWDTAKELGFDNNRDYCLSIVSGNNDYQSIVDEYFDLWLGHDSYYDEWDVKIIYDKNEMIAISLAITE